ncbi:MAG TPA: glycoside hydrolase family 30 beta sandwich domain-containing protein [Chryseosolibacter sp.]|nr:glycoside hydrolase family 30 beta sandwich domain-containing protein [Chryseosolibacter sp.]
MIRNYWLTATWIVFFGLVIACSGLKNEKQTSSENGSVSHWLTTGDRKSLLEQQPALSFVNESPNQSVIQVDTAQRFQSIDGFGYALTGGSADLINQKLDAEERSRLLEELFLTDDNGIGISYLRVSIGASDLDDHVFSYCDLPAGQTDPELKNFTLKEDRENLIPVLKQILALNPDIKIMGSPWSAPVWMKTNNLPKAGSLKPEFYAAYALYFVKYIQEMAKEGVTIDAITLQNEPENPHNTPSMLMTAEEQTVFVKNHLGPAFEKAGIRTKIVVFDHNCDHPEYPISILNDEEARKYIDGSAFHLYIGEIDAMSKVHEAHPDKNLYFTEQWTSGEGKFDGDLRWHVKNLIVGATRNWSRNVLEWNLAADPNFDPHTDDGGCTMCMGALTIGDSVARNVSYYIIGHASKFVPPGSVRIASNIVDGLHNVAFITPERKKVLVVVNDNDARKEFVIKEGNRLAEASLAAGAVATYVWE